MKKLLVAFMAVLIMTASVMPIQAKAAEYDRTEVEQYVNKVYDKLDEDARAAIIDDVVNNTALSGYPEAVESIKKYFDSLPTPGGDGYKEDKVDDVISQINNTVSIKADLDKGKEWLSPETIAIISTAMGAIITVALLAVGVFTAVDVLFMVVPPLNQALTERAEASGKVDKNGDTKIRFVSRAAVRAYKETQESGKNVIIAYGKKRAIEYIAVAVVVYLLLSGNFNSILTLALRIISGAVDSVGNIANGAPTGGIILMLK